jgi:hypothetical protein
MAAFWVLAVPIVRVIVLMMETAGISETSVNFTKLHGATTQKAAIFIFAVLRTSNLTLYMFAAYFIQAVIINCGLLNVVSI